MRGCPAFRDADTGCASIRFAHAAYTGDIATQLINVHCAGPFVQLYIRDSRIGDEGERASIVLLGIGPVELDPGGFELLDEALQVLDVEPDMVEHAPLRGGGGRVGLVEPQLGAWN